MIPSTIIGVASKALLVPISLDQTKPKSLTLFLLILVSGENLCSSYVLPYANQFPGSDSALSMRSSLIKPIELEPLTESTISFESCSFEQDQINKKLNNIKEFLKYIFSPLDKYSNIFSKFWNKQEL